MNYFCATIKSYSHGGNGVFSRSYGMGWFPGYAINVETGERTNIAYGENSMMAHQHGADMKWNPTSQNY